MYLIRFLLVIVLVIAFNNSKAQKTTYIPGPANLDTSRLSHIYFLRDKPDNFPDNWLGVVINNNHGLCVKAKTNSITVTHTAQTGVTLFHTQVGDSRNEITLDIIPGKNYYVELVPNQKEKGQIEIAMNVLPPEDAVKRMHAFPATIQERYCILPFDGDNDFLENVYQDSVRWYADESHEYLFRPLNSWEVIVRSKLRTVLAFRNSVLSTTYSETGGIQYLPLTRCQSATAFEQYCKQEFIPSTLLKRTDRLVSSNTKPVELREGIMYAQLVSIENTTESDDKLSESPLLIRSVYIVFFWKNEKGRGNSACLYTSERGLENELHAIQVLEERLLESWQGFRIMKK